MNQVETLALQNHKPRHRKLSRADKEEKLQLQRTKLSQMVDLFYEKVKGRIDKSISKDSKKSTLLIKDLLDAVSQHPKQQLFEISRLYDQFFNEMNKINNVIGQFIKSVETLREKIGKELEVIQQRQCLKQEKEQTLGDYSLAVLRKINFKKEKAYLNAKIEGISTLNKKLLKFETPSGQGKMGSSLEIDGKQLQIHMHRFKKLYFESKQRQYLLCLCNGQNAQTGALQLYSDKLQKITGFPHIPAIPLSTLVDIVQIQEYIYVVWLHQIMRFSLVNENDVTKQYFRDRIHSVASYQGGLILWLHNNLQTPYIAFLNRQIQIYHHFMLPLAVISLDRRHFKLTNTKNQEQIYFTVRTFNAKCHLYKILNLKAEEFINNFEPCCEIIEHRQKGKTVGVLMRRGNQLSRFVAGERLGKTVIEIHSMNGEVISQCCLLGEHFYALTQSGKHMLECHFRAPLGNLQE